MRRGPPNAKRPGAYHTLPGGRKARRALWDERSGELVAEPRTPAAPAEAQPPYDTSRKLGRLSSPSASARSSVTFQPRALRSFSALRRAAARSSWRP